VSVNIELSEGEVRFLRAITGGITGQTITSLKLWDHAGEAQVHLMTIYDKVKKEKIK